MQTVMSPRPTPFVASSLEGLNYFELSRTDWCEAARLHRDLASRGHKIPLTDAVLAHVALREDYPVFTTDPHFDLIPDLRKYEPE
jgi:predicted nucleic acid-binding protein